MSLLSSAALGAYIHLESPVRGSKARTWIPNHFECPQIIPFSSFSHCNWRYHGRLFLYKLILNPIRQIFFLQRIIWKAQIRDIWPLNSHTCGSVAHPACCYALLCSLLVTDLLIWGRKKKEKKRDETTVKYNLRCTPDITSLAFKSERATWLFHEGLQQSIMIDWVNDALFSHNKICLVCQPGVDMANHSLFTTFCAVKWWIDCSMLAVRLKKKGLGRPQQLPSAPVIQIAPYEATVFTQPGLIKALLMSL